MMQICVFNTRLFSLHNTLNYAIHGACLQMVLLTDIYRNLTSLWIKPRERAFKQFKSPVLNVLKLSNSSQLKELFLTCMTASPPFIQLHNLNATTHPIPQRRYCVCGSWVSTYISPLHSPFCHTVISLIFPKVTNMWSYRSTPPTCLHGAHRTTLPLPFLLPPLITTTTATTTTTTWGNRVSDNKLALENECWSITTDSL